MLRHLFGAVAHGSILCSKLQIKKWYELFAIERESVVKIDTKGLGQPAFESEPISLLYTRRRKNQLKRQGAGNWSHKSGEGSEEL